MVLLLFTSFLASFLVAIVLIVWGRGHARRYAAGNPQRFHRGDIPRLGGVAVLAGMACGGLVAAIDANIGPGRLNTDFAWSLMLPWLAVAIPTVVGGAYEDVSQRVPVRYRLVLTALSAGLACVVLGLAVPRLGFPIADEWLLALPWLGIALAFVAISGLPHAFNIIDGYNGLAGTVALLNCLAIAHVAMQVGDRQLASVIVCLAGATLGFLMWNYPRGLIFAGDCGAYFWGIMIAIAAILLVQRHPQVSPWFPMLLLIYPVWETFFSIYRKLARGGSPGVADALHFHQLIYRRIVRGVFHDDESRRMLMRNNRTSPYLWGFTFLTVAPAVLFWRNSVVLMFFCGLFVVTYVVAYLAIVRFKVPGWLRR